MRISFLFTTIALALNVDASRVYRRELSPFTKCVNRLDIVIQQISSYENVIDAYVQDQELERAIKKSIQQCNKVTSISEDEFSEFMGAMKSLVQNVEITAGEFSKKKATLDDIQVVRPLLVASISKINKQIIFLERLLMKVSPEKNKQEFQGYIDQLNRAMKGVMDTYEIPKQTI